MARIARLVQASEGHPFWVAPDSTEENVTPQETMFGRVNPRHQYEVNIEGYTFRLEGRVKRLTPARNPQEAHRWLVSIDSHVPGLRWPRIFFNVILRRKLLESGRVAVSLTVFHRP